MSHVADVRVTSAVPPSVRARGLLRWVCTNNPFYVLSAGLFLVGLYVSFGAQVQAAATYALMGGLVGYTLLLAVTACLLVRFGNVWDDVRTVLLLVVLLFLATSVTFDEVLVFDPARGFGCYLGGLLFAVAVTEGLLRGIRLKLPAWYRGPYYLILALFFLYPLALRPLVDDPQGEALQWGLFGFAPAAGLAFLALLPGVRRGSVYVRGNGSPWRWPLYPWVLFGLLAGAVPARAFLLCWSMQLLQTTHFHDVLFGPFFVVPFGLALAVLVLEAGLVSGRAGVLRAALAVPVGLVVLLVAGHRDDPIYRGFLETFATRTGVDALAATLLGAAGFYAYAARRRVAWATEAVTAALAVLAFVRPDTLETGDVGLPRLAPLLAAAILQLALGMWRRETWRCLLGAGGLAAVAALVLPDDSLRRPVAFHLVLVVLLGVGAAFDGALARLLRAAGAGLALVACLAATFVAFDRGTDVPPWAFGLYPLALAAVLAMYGRLLRDRPAVATAAAALVCWLGMSALRGYLALRKVVAGLDQLALSLALFAVAVLVSMGKAGVLSRWVAARWGKGPPSPVAPGHDIWQPEDGIIPDPRQPEAGPGHAN